METIDATYLDEYSERLERIARLVRLIDRYIPMLGLTMRVCVWKWHRGEGIEPAGTESIQKLEAREAFRWGPIVTTDRDVDITSLWIVGEYDSGSFRIKLVYEQTDHAWSQHVIAGTLSLQKLLAVRLALVEVTNMLIQRIPNFRQELDALRPQI